MTKTIRTYEDFWPFYLAEHRRPLTRAIHVAGTGLGLMVLVLALATRIWWLIAVALAIGYGFAWLAHFFVEKNRPATFTYPWWSFISDFRMFWLAMTGRLQREVDQYQVVLR